MGRRYFEELVPGMTSDSKLKSTAKLTVLDPLERRLRALKKLHAKGLISDKQYQERKRLILDEM